MTARSLHQQPDPPARPKRRRYEHAGLERRRLTGVIWQGATNASDILLLVAAIVAVVEVVILVAKGAGEAALLPAAVALVALGLLAV